MCGIFGFALARPVSLKVACRVLQALETSKYPEEKTPVGGFGAGAVILDTDGSFSLLKVGKTADSPAKHLAETIENGRTRIFLGHVRMPSPEFMSTSEFMETAQPFLANCFSDLKIFSAHNGFISNYQELRAALGNRHVFESEKIGLIDSEVIPHVFEDKLKSSERDDALDSLDAALDGSFALGLLQKGRQGIFFHLLHRGKTRGLHVWTNDHQEIIFCSRTEPIIQEFKYEMDRRFVETVTIRHQEEKRFKETFQIQQ